MSPRANNSKGEVVVNDSPVDCQSHRADRSIFSAEKIQDRWFKVSAAASVGASAINNANRFRYRLKKSRNQGGFEIFSYLS